MTREMEPETMEFRESVEPAQPLDTSSTAEPAVVAPPARSRLAVVMLVVAGLLLIGAVVFGVLGLQAQSDASDQRDQAATATHRRHDLADQQEQLQSERDALEKKVTALPDQYDAIGTAFVGLADTHDHYVDLLIQSVELYNAGDTPGSVAVLTADGQAAINDLMAKRIATQQAVQGVEDALQQIQEGL